MAIKTQGPLKFSEIRKELGLTGKITIGQSEARGLAGISEGEIKFSDFYGKSNFDGVYLKNGILKDEHNFYEHEKFYLSNSINFKTFLDLSKTVFDYSKTGTKPIHIDITTKNEHQFPDQLMLYLENETIGLKKKKLIKDSGSGNSATYSFEDAKNVQNFRNYFINYIFVQNKTDSPIFFHIQTIDSLPVNNFKGIDGELMRNAIVKRPEYYGSGTRYTFESSSSNKYETEMGNDILKIQLLYNSAALEIISKKRISAEHVYFSVRNKSNLHLETYKSYSKQEEGYYKDAWIYKFYFYPELTELFDYHSLDFENFIFSVLTSDVYEKDAFRYYKS